MINLARKSCRVVVYKCHLSLYVHFLSASPSSVVVASSALYIPGRETGSDWSGENQDVKSMHTKRCMPRANIVFVNRVAIYLTENSCCTEL